MRAGHNVLGHWKGAPVFMGGVDADAFLATKLMEDEPSEPADEGEARRQLSAILVEVAHFNATLDQTVSQLKRNTLAQSSLSVQGGLIDKLEQWIERLKRQLTAIVRRIADAASFSISVGTSLSLTVHFSVSP